MSKIKIVVPLPYNPIPYQNEIRSRYAAGRVMHYKTAKLKHYQEHIGMVARSTANRMGWKMLPKFFKYELTLYFKNRVHGDLDNCEKSIMDAMEKIIYDNDKWGCDKHVKYHYGKEARIEITIEEAPHP